jgi:serine/threonine protein phosphatase PrpC
MQIELALLSQPGGRPYNEDACGHWHSDRHLCCVLADGAGGHGGGDVASKLAVSHILNRYAQSPCHDPAALMALLQDTNRELLAHRNDRPELRQMHSTVVALSIDLQSRTALWGHCGDSRLYAFRDGRIARRTHDHSLVQSLIDAGMLTEAEAQHHARRSELYSALGTQGDDLRVSVEPQAWPLARRDVLMLCTDGLWEWVPDPQIEAALAGAADPHVWLASLEQQVRQATAGRPSHDNFSALAVWLGELD